MKARKKMLDNRLEMLQDELDYPKTTIEDTNTLISEIKKLQAEKDNKRKRARLDLVNKKHADHRQILKDVLLIDLPKEDINTSDGSFHATKIKKYPKLVKFMEKYKYARFNYQDNCYITLDYNRYTYSLKRSEYCYPNPTVQHEFINFKEALKYNSIQVKPMTFSKYLSLEARILKESKRIEEQVNKSNEKIKTLEIYFLEGENLINRQRSSYYTYYSIV